MSNYLPTAKKKMPTLVQFSSYLPNKLLHKENCTKVGIPTFAVNKILLSNIISEQKHVIAMYVFSFFQYCWDTLFMYSCQKS